MKKSIKITIPEPCHEDWNKMTPTEKGKFCKVCTKEVFDFTTSKDEEIVKILSNTKNACGRFKKSQVNRTLRYSTKSRKSLLPYAASLLLPAAFLATLQSQAQEELPQKPYTSLGIGKFSNQNLRRGEVQINTIKDSITVSGTVTDNSNLPLPGVNIIVKGTTKGVQSDFDGNYKITTPINSVLTFRYLGYVSQEITLSTISTTINIVLLDDNVMLGEVILGGVPEIRTPNPLRPNIFNNSYNLSSEKRELKKKRKEARENNRRFKLIQKERKKEARELKKKNRNQ